MTYKYDVWGIDKKGNEELQVWCGRVKTKKEIDEWYDRFGRHHEAQGHEIVRLFKIRGTSTPWKAIIDGIKMPLKEYIKRRKNGKT